MAEQKIPERFSVFGLLEVISKETSVVLTKNSGHPVIVRKDVSNLRITPESGEAISINFRRDVGYELNGERVSYSCRQREEKGIAVEGIFPNVPFTGNYRIITQKIVPLDGKLPQYVVNDYTLLDFL